MLGCKKNCYCLGSVRIDSYVYEYISSKQRLNHSQMEYRVTAERFKFKGHFDKNVFSFLFCKESSMKERPDRSGRGKKLREL